MALEVEILEGEVLDDSLLDSMSEWMKSSPYLSFARYGKNARQPVEINLTSECIGKLNPRGLFFRCRHSGLTDDLFSKCNQLEFLQLGTSTETILNEYPTHIARQPLKLVEVNGWGLLHAGRPFWDFLENGKKEKRFDYIYWV